MGTHYCPDCTDDTRMRRGTHHPTKCPEKKALDHDLRLRYPSAGHDPKVAVAAPKQRIASCVPPVSIIEEARAMAFGAFTKGYGPFNWRGKSLSMNVYLDAIMRHLLSLIDGEDIAVDSGVHHLSHIKAGCGILLDALHNGELTDDRPSAGTASKLLATPPHAEPHRPARGEPPSVSSVHDSISKQLDDNARGGQ